MDDIDTDDSEDDIDISNPQDRSRILITSVLCALRSACASIANPPKCWTLLGSQREWWTALNGSQPSVIDYVLDKFGFKLTWGTMVITNAFVPVREGTLRNAVAPRNRQQVIGIRGHSEGHRCQVRLSEPMYTWPELHTVVSCRAVAHFVSLWMRTIHRRLISRVLVLSWHAKLPTCSTQLIYEFVDWTKKNIDDIVSIFYDGSPASWHRCRFVIPCHKCRIWKEEMKRHPRLSSLIQSEWDPPCRYDTTTV